MTNTEKLKQALSTIYPNIRLTTQIEFIICDIASLCNKEGINLEQVLSGGMYLYRAEK